MSRRLALYGLAAALVGGCGPKDPGRKPDPVAVQGVVQRAGRPVADVTINFLPTTGGQNQVGAALKGDGKFDVKINPGKYCFVVEGSPAALKAVPAKYQVPSESNTVDVPSGGTTSLTVTLAD